jgi:hypothetical protein
MERTECVYLPTKDDAEESAAALCGDGWTAEVASEATDQGWLVTAHHDDGEDDGFWTKGRWQALME